MKSGEGGATLTGDDMDKMDGVEWTRWKWS
jgi:hypothetical protein